MRILPPLNSSFSYPSPKPKKNHGTRAEKRNSIRGRASELFLSYHRLPKVHFGCFGIYHTYTLSMVRKIIAVIIKVEAFLEDDYNRRYGINCI